MRFKAECGSEAQRLRGERELWASVKAAARSAEGMEQNLGRGQRRRKGYFRSREHRARSPSIRAASS